MSGFIPIKRSLFEHFLAREKRVFSRFEAWLDLIQMATFTEQNEQIIKGKMIVCKRGQLIASVRFLQDRWAWSMHKVTDYLELLRSQDMLLIDKESGVSRITLVNFEKHNDLNGKLGPPNSKRNAKWNSKSRNHTGFALIEGTQTDTEKGTVREQSGNKSNKVNKGKECLVGNAETYSPEDEFMFESFTKWVDKNALNVSKMKEPFTIDQYLQLRKKIPNREAVQELLLKMHNWKPLLQKNNSAYLTILNWSKKDYNNNPNEKNKSQNSNTEDALKVIYGQK